MHVLVSFKARPQDKHLINEILSKYARTLFIDEVFDYEMLKDVEIILSGSGLDLTDEILNSVKKLKFIQLISAGADSVPFEKIDENVVVATNAGGNAIPVAEHAMALLLTATKKIIEHDQNMKKGIWMRKNYGETLYGKKLGIIGFGHIGKEIAKRAKAFGMKIFAINRSGKTDFDVDFIGDISKLDYVLGSCDYIILALPLTKKTRGLIDKDKLKKMKRNAILINVGRGAVIKEEDLYYHLIENPNFIAALDVWWHYPKKGDNKAFQKYPFHKLKNIIMTPHIAGFSKELREDIIKNALFNIIRFIKGEKPKNIVNRNDYI